MTAGATKPISINSPIQVVCEGSSDKGFLEHLMHERGLQGFDVGYPTQETAGTFGLGGLRSYLLALDTSADRAKMKGLLVVADADTDPDERFSEIRGLIGAIGCRIDAPFTPHPVAGKNLTVEVFMMPGRGRNGTLEHLLLDAVLDENQELELCVNGFRDCLKKPLDWSDNKQAKMRLHALIAGCCEEEPSTNLATVWKKSGNPIPLSSGRFDELVDTLRHFAAL